MTARKGFKANGDKEDAADRIPRKRTSFHQTRYGLVYGKWSLCAAATKDGSQCQMPPVEGPENAFCKFHARRYGNAT